MKDIIKKAIDGGWKPFGSIKTDGKGWGVGEVYANFYNQPVWVLDPLFWQAMFSDEYKEIAVFFDGELGECQLQVEWLGHAMNFHKINLTEGWNQAVEYLQEITNIK